MSPRRQPLWMAPAGLAAALLLCAAGWLAYEFYEGRGLREARALVEQSRRAPALRDSAALAARARLAAPRAAFPYEELIRIHRALSVQDPASFRELEMAATELVLLDERNPLGHAGLADAALRGRRDPARAFQRYRRALALAPAAEGLYPPAAEAARAMGRPRDMLPLLAAGARAIPGSKVVAALRAQLGE